MTKRFYCQQKPRKWYKNDVIPPQECIDNPLDYILALTPREQRLFNALVYHINKYEHCYPSQETIGSWIGIGRQQTNVLIGKLVRLGLLIKQKCYDDTSLYRLPKFFYKKEVVEVLKPFITAFQFIKNIILNAVNLIAKRSHKNENTTSILMPLGYSYISSPCPTYIVEELSPGDSGVKRNNNLLLSKEKVKEDPLALLTKMFNARMRKFEDQELNRWIV